MSPNELRERLAATYTDYAEEAIRNHQWEAATAYQTAASLALATAVTIEEGQK